MGWTILESNSGGGEIFPTRPDRTWSPTKPPIQLVANILLVGKSAAGWL
jgi:hypothetical protein